MTTAIPMEPEKAARLIEEWIKFYGMDDPEMWPAEDYAYVERACRAMRGVIDILKGTTESKTKEQTRDIVAVLRDWPRMHSMNNPEMWEAEDFPFVRSALDAIMFAVSYLQEIPTGQ